MRLIDADALLNDISDLKKSPWFNENYFDHKNIRKEAIEIVEQLCIDKAPTIDAEPLVRCKDCKHFRTFRTSSDGEEIRMCVGKGIVDLNYDDFCSKGERKDDDKSCDTCKHHDKGWDDIVCDVCTKAYSNWERKDDE